MEALVVGTGCNVSSETTSSIVSTVCGENAVISVTGSEFVGTTSCSLESCPSSAAEDCESIPSVGAFSGEDSFDASSSSVSAPMTLSVRTTPIAIATAFLFGFSFGLSCSRDNGPKGVSGVGSAGGSVSTAAEASVTTSPVAIWT